MNPASTVVLITGASSGIGLACAQHLASQGFQVYGTSRNPSRYADKGWPFQLVAMDVVSDDSVQHAVKEVVEKAGRIDVVVNNAGGGIAGAIEETSTEEGWKTLDTNFFGVHRVTRAVLPYMREQGGGKIIQMSSIAAQFGLPYRGFYSASKAAVEGYSEALRNEVRPYNIQVVLLEPGSIKTPINDNRAIAEAAQRESSPYFEVSTRLFEKINADVDGGLPPVAVAKQVEAIIRTKNPRVRYIVSSFIQKLSVVLYHILPTPTFMGILRKNYKLED